MEPKDQARIAPASRQVAPKPRRTPSLNLQQNSTVHQEQKESPFNPSPSTQQQHFQSHSLPDVTSHARPFSVIPGLDADVCQWLTSMSIPFRLEAGHHPEHPRIVLTRPDDAAKGDIFGRAISKGVFWLVPGVNGAVVVLRNCPTYYGLPSKDVSTYVPIEFTSRPQPPMSCSNIPAPATNDSESAISAPPRSSMQKGRSASISSSATSRRLNHGSARQNYPDKTMNSQDDVNNQSLLTQSLNQARNLSNISKSQDKILSFPQVQFETSGNSFFQGYPDPSYPAQMAVEDTNPRVPDSASGPSSKRSPLQHPASVAGASFFAKGLSTQICGLSSTCAQSTTPSSVLAAANTSSLQLGNEMTPRRSNSQGMSSGGKPNFYQPMGLSSPATGTASSPITRSITATPSRARANSRGGSTIASLKRPQDETSSSPPKRRASGSTPTGDNKSGAGGSSRRASLLSIKDPRDPAAGLPKNLENEDYVEMDLTIPYNGPPLGFVTMTGGMVGPGYGMSADGRTWHAPKGIFGVRFSIEQLSVGKQDVDPGFRFASPALAANFMRANLVRIFWRHYSKWYPIVLEDSKATQPPHEVKWEYHDKFYLVQGMTHENYCVRGFVGKLEVIEPEGSSSCQAVATGQPDVLAEWVIEDADDLNVRHFSAQELDDLFDEFDREVENDRRRDVEAEDTHPERSVQARMAAPSSFGDRRTVDQPQLAAPATSQVNTHFGTSGTAEEEDPSGPVSPRLLLSGLSGSGFIFPEAAEAAEAARRSTATQQRESSFLAESMLLESPSEETTYVLPREPQPDIPGHVWPDWSINDFTMFPPIITEGEAEKFGKNPFGPDS